MVDDRDGRREAGRFTLLTALVSGALAAIVVAAGLRWGMSGRGFGLGSAAAIGVGVGAAFGGLMIVLNFAMVRRGIVPIVPGDDAATRKAVRRAVRDGHADDRRIDALARDFVGRSPRVPWLPYLYLALVALAVLRLIGGAHQTRDIVVQSTLAVIWLVCAAGARRQQRRLTTYGNR